MPTNCGSQSTFRSYFVYFVYIILYSRCVWRTALGTSSSAVMLCRPPLRLVEKNHRTSETSHRA